MQTLLPKLISRTVILRHTNRNITLAMSTHKTYEDAIRALNFLQSNASTIEKISKARDKFAQRNIPEVLELLQQIGISQADIDKLNVIHVSGTKGKGSTCAFCESILRHHGFKTGFYSSPHLIEVRERIQISGVPLPKETFASYFWEVYEGLQINEIVENTRRVFYFRFLTILAFHIFLKEKVNVAVIEVGIGGRYDCTNVIKNPVVCGVASLDYDHVSILGNTLEKIAWHKAGIFKPLCPAVSVLQPAECIQVLAKESEIIGCPFYVAPDLSLYDWCNFPMKLGLAGKVQYINASLALQLTSIWLHRQQDLFISPTKVLSSNNGFSKCQSFSEVHSLPPFMITKNFYEGLVNCHWPGRHQILKMKNITYYLDGAHTGQSIMWCQKWFCEEAGKETDQWSDSSIRILVFNSTADRDPERLLVHLLKCNFDAAIFCPNNVQHNPYSGCTLSNKHLISSKLNPKKKRVDFKEKDQANFRVTRDTQMRKCETNYHIWLKLLKECHSGVISSETSNNGININEEIDNDEITSGAVSNTNLSSESYILESIDDALSWISERTIKHTLVSQSANATGNNQHNVHTQVLVTGSMYLVGGMLSLLTSTG